MLEGGAMASLTLTSTVEIRCPIEVVRAQFSDLKHPIVNNVHRDLELILHASDEWCLAPP